MASFYYRDISGVDHICRTQRELESFLRADGYTSSSPEWTRWQTLFSNFSNGGSSSNANSFNNALSTATAGKSGGSLIDAGAALIHEEAKQTTIVASEISNLIRTLKDGYDDVIKSVTDIAESWGEIDVAASTFSKSIGLGARGMASLRDNSLEVVENLKLAQRYGVDAKDLIEIRQKYDTELGRRVSFNDEGAESVAAMSNVMTPEKTVELTSKMDAFGISARKSLSYANNLFSMAGKTGLSFEKLSDNFLQHVKDANKYTFKDGLVGLQRMAQKSLEIGLNMEAATSVANTMMDEGLESATKMGAQLQVLGGSFAQFGNPLTMFSNGLLDTEELHNQIGEMVSEMATFNNETGELEISVADKLRLRAAAKAMNLNYEDLTDSAMRQGTRNKIAHDLDMNGLRVTGDTREMLMNLGTIENGKSGANIGGKFYEMKDIVERKDLQDQLMQENKPEEENIAQIAMDVRSIVDYLDFGEKQTKAREANILKDRGWANYIKENVASYKLTDYYQSRQANLGIAGNIQDAFVSNLNYGQSIDDATTGIIQNIPILRWVPGVKGAGDILGMAAGLGGNVDALFAQTGAMTGGGFLGGLYQNHKTVEGETPNVGNDALVNAATNGGYNTWLSPIPTSTYSNSYYPTSNYYQTQQQGYGYGYQNQEQTVNINPGDLKVNGTLKLDVNGTMLNFDELMKNEQFKRQLAQAVTDAYNAKNGRYGNVNGDYGY